MTPNEAIPMESKNNSGDYIILGMINYGFVLLKANPDIHHMIPLRQVIYNNIKYVLNELKEVQDLQLVHRSDDKNFKESIQVCFVFRIHLFSVKYYRLYSFDVIITLYTLITLIFFQSGHNELKNLVEKWNTIVPLGCNGIGKSTICNAIVRNSIMSQEEMDIMLKNHDINDLYFNINKYINTDEKKYVNELKKNWVSEDLNKKISVDEKSLDEEHYGLLYQEGNDNSTTSRNESTYFGVPSIAINFHKASHVLQMLNNFQVCYFFYIRKSL